MAIWLKQSTAVTLKIGPFLDDTDGKTAETALTISQADVRLSKNGANIAQKNESTACTHDELGIYDCPVDTTDTGTLGRLQLWVHESGALPVWHEFMVVPANVWDSLYGADYLQTHAVEIANNLITAASINADAITAAKIADDAISSEHLNTGAITADAFAADAIVAATLATGAITADAFAADAIVAATLATGAITADAFAANAIVAATLAADCITAAKVAADVHAETADAVWDEVVTGHDGAGKAGAQLWTDIDAILVDTGTTLDGLITTVDTVVDAVKAKTDSLTFTVAGDVDCNVQSWAGAAAPAMTGDAFARLGAPAGASVSADIAAVKAQTGAIETDTQDLQTQVGVDGAGLTAVPWNAAWDTEVQSECTDALNAYDPPTNAEMVARTLAAADYATAAALTTVDGIVDSILADTGTDGVVVAGASKTGYTLSDAGVDALFDRASSATLSFESLILRTYQMVSNKMAVTEATGDVALRNIGDTATIATGNVASSSGTTTRAELTWA